MFILLSRSIASLFLSYCSSGTLNWGIVKQINDLGFLNVFGDNDKLKFSFANESLPVSL